MGFNTLKFSQRLQQGGVSRKQADIHAEAVNDLLVVDLVTVDDLAALSTDIRGELKFQSADIKNELRILEQRMTIKLGGIATIMAGLVIAAQKLF